MVGAKSEHKTCAYKLIDHLVSPKTNAAIAEYFGEAPGNKLACQETSDPNHCETYHAEDEDYFSQRLLLEHPDHRVPGRSHRREVHRLRGVDQEVVGDPRLTGADYRSTDPRGRDEPAQDAVRPARRADGVAGGRLPRGARRSSSRRRSSPPTRSRTRWSRRSRLENFNELFSPTYLRIVGRTLLIAALVTVLCIVIAVPFAFFMARVAPRRLRALLVAAVLVPLWASYLVKAYAWRAMLQPEGVMDSVFGGTPGYGLVAVVLTLTYLWLPYMILPVYAGFERLPEAHLEASADLGGSAVYDVPPDRAALADCRRSSRARSSPSR